MIIIVSACLLGENCKYDGGNNLNEKVARLSEDNELIPVCPEVLGGLTTPRIPCEIVDGKVIDRNGTSRDSEFRSGAQKALEIAVKEGADCAILQSRSPSCGIGTIYDGSFTGKLIPGDGIFADLLKKHGIRVIDVKDI